MTKTLLAAAILAAFSATAAAQQQQQQQRLYDDHGRSIGTATTSGNVTTFRDASGRTTSTATQDSQGNTVLRDATGRVIGRSSR